METILLDSSVWMSLFARDAHFGKALDIFKQMPNSGIKIIVPIIVYVEVINCLNRKKPDQKKLDEAMRFFLHSKKIQITFPDRRCWYEALKKSEAGIHLKTLDLLILIFALDSKVSEFYSFDRKLDAAYRKLTH